MNTSDVIVTLFYYLLSYEHGKNESDINKISYRDEIIDYCVVWYDRIKEYSNLIQSDVRYLLVYQDHKEEPELKNLKPIDEESLNTFKANWERWTSDKPRIEGTSADIKTYESLEDFYITAIFSLAEILNKREEIFVSMLDRVFSDIPYYADKFPTIEFDSKETKSTNKKGRPGKGDLTTKDRINLLCQYFTPKEEFFKDQTGSRTIRREIISKILGVPLTTINTTCDRESYDSDIKGLKIENTNH